MFHYRLQGYKGRSKRKESVTRIRYKTREEAEEDMGNYISKWKNLGIVKRR